MAAKGSVEKTVDFKRNICHVKWVWTADGSGDVDENGSADPSFFFTVAQPMFLVGVTIGYTSGDNNYDVYVKDSQGIDILKGLGVNLANSASDSGNRFCPVNTSQDIGTATNASGTPIILMDEDIEIIVDEAGAGHIGTLHLYFMIPQTIVR